MDYLFKITTLNNRYFGMRHGQSLANCEGLIVSTPENGIPAYGLSDEGRLQIERSISKNTKLDSSVQIISSDFKRARESAEIARSLLNATHELILNKKLRERDFGDYELTSDSNYNTAWTNDAVSSAHTIDNVESADSVMSRVSSLIISLEEQFNGVVFLLIAHGDTLQILQTAFQKHPASKQRELKHLETAEIREFVLSTEN